MYHIGVRKKKESPAYMRQEKRRERYEEKKNSNA
jgi:hypothetical protein